MPPVPLVDPTTIDTSRVLVDREGIRRANPQRFEMEQLTAIVALVPEKHLIIGYKDVEPDEFWVRGHLPDFPLMPGVLICEAAAQLSSYFFCQVIKLPGSTFLGFGGMEDVPLSRPGPAGRSPGARLAGDPDPSPPDDLRNPGLRQNQRRDDMVYHGRIIGVPLTNPDEKRPET